MPSLFERLALWAERTFKTDIRYLARGGFWAGVGQGAVSLSSLALALVVARYVPQEIYGTYKYVIAVVGTLSIFSLSNINVAVLQSAASGYGGALPAGYRINLRWSIGIFLGALAVGAYYLVAGNLAIGLGILIGGCAAPFITSAGLYGQFLSGKKDFARAATYADLIGVPLPVLALIITALVYPTALALLIVYFGANVLVTYYLYRRTLTHYHAERGQEDPGMLSYAKHLSLMGIVTGLAGNIDQLLAFHFVGAAGLAVYNFATGIVDQTKGPLKSLDAMMQARFANRSDGEFRKGLMNKFLLLFVSSAAFVVFYYFIAPWGYKTFFPMYQAAVPYSRLYAVSILAIVFGPASSYLSAKKKVREQYWANFISSLTQIACMAVGTIFWGLWGLVAARVVIRISGSYLFYAAYMLTAEKEAVS